jgi:hypothetical protein
MVSDSGTPPAQAFHAWLPAASLLTEGVPADFSLHTPFHSLKIRGSTQQKPSLTSAESGAPRCVDVLAKGQASKHQIVLKTDCSSAAAHRNVPAVSGMHDEGPSLISCTTRA